MMKSFLVKDYGLSQNSSSPSRFVSSDSNHQGHSHNHSQTKSDFVHIQWSGAEHKQLGDLGFEKACDLVTNSGIEACKSLRIDRADRKLPMTYGQVLSLGDFYLQPDKAFTETRRVNSIEKLFRCIDKEGKVHEEQKHNPEADYPDCTWVNVLYGGDYLNVVTKNYEHFAWDNMRAYVYYHERAIAYARAAFKAKNKGRDKIAERLLNKALYINAFSDHFLTDAFAAGHLRVPRFELKKWAKENTAPLVGSYIGDALGMILHDYEGRNSWHKEVGLKVKNALGYEWVTRSDKQLNVCAKEDDMHIQMPLQAVVASLVEVFTAYQTGQKPEGTFAATWYVPFPDDAGIIFKWQGILNAENGYDRVREMRDSLPGPLKMIVRTRYVRRMIVNLPEILFEFNKRVQQEIIESKHLQIRLPDSYLRNFMHLN